MTRLDKDQLMKYLQIKIDNFYNLMKEVGNGCPAYEDASARMNQLIKTKQAIDYGTFTIYDEDDEDKSLNSSEYKEALTKQFKLLQRASEVSIGTDNVKAMPQMTEAMLQIGCALGLQMEDNK